ncbi:cytochrome c [Nonlabens mediterrranea]|uniref:Cytochrome c n=1 Tax=Nonlabens mediterrranea TaxID=1419947 RepID=A0ABS0A8E2_9FLAO|nr:cytochrome c [Nonlabens mediterrranea]
MYAFASLVIVSCGGDSNAVDAKSDRSVQYFPNMYESVGYETYQEGDIFEGNVEAQLPVEGTVNRGWLPYEYANSNEGYASAKADLKNPLPYTEENLASGQELYNIYCAICHGTKGDGKGHLVKTEKILGVPSYADRDISQGSIYHVMYWGINYMGSYASQTSIEERWQIAHHVDALTRDLKGQDVQEFVTVEDVTSLDTHTEGHVVEDHSVEMHNEDSHDGDHDSQEENHSSTEGE